jgi:hypothetical protein
MSEARFALFENMTLAQLEAECERIKAQNAHWRTHPNQDGSYEASMSYDGFYIVMRRIQELKDREQNNSL